MNRPHTVPSPSWLQRASRHLAATTILAVGLAAVYGAGGLLETVLTRAVVS